MFERFTEAARQVVIKAQEAARELDHAYIGTELLLLGLLAEPAEVPAQALSAVGVDAEQVRTQILARVGRGKEPPTRSQIPFTPRAKKVLELGLREALSLGHNMIGTGHLLLGLLREEDGLGVQILIDLGATPEALRTEILGRLGGPDPAAEEMVVTRRGGAVARAVASEVAFTVKPDDRLRRLLMEAAARAMHDQREEFTVDDLLNIIREMPELGERRE